MPYYEYRCCECNHEFEQENTYMRRKDATCPKCSSMDCLQLPSAAYPIFKGTGFYENDYKKKRNEK